MEAIINALLRTVTFVTPGVPALVAVAEEKLNPNVSQLADKRMCVGKFWKCFTDKKKNKFFPSITISGILNGQESSSSTL